MLLLSVHCKGQDRKHRFSQIFIIFSNNLTLWHISISCNSKISIACLTSNGICASIRLFTHSSHCVIILFCLRMLTIFFLYYFLACTNCRYGWFSTFNFIYFLNTHCPFLSFLRFNKWEKANVVLSVFFSQLAPIECFEVKVQISVLNVHSNCSQLGFRFAHPLLL